MSGSLSVVLKDGVGANMNIGAYKNANGDIVTGSVPLVAGSPVATGNPLPISSAGTGTPSDTAWAGSGDGSVVSVLKALWAKLGTTLSTALKVGGADLSAANPAPVKLGDGTNAVQVTAQGSLVVSGQTAVGSAPVAPPLSVSGTDAGGLKRHLLTDATGALQVVSGANGTAADAAYAGSGAGTVVSVLKGLYALLAAALTIRPGALTITQTVVTLAAATNTQLLAANASRRYLLIVNIGTGDAWLAFGSTAAVAATGYPLPAAAAAGGQGGGYSCDASTVPSGAIQAISTAGTTLVVLEG